MAVTCLAIGDPHFQTSNIEQTDQFIRKVNQLVEELDPTFVVILGDLLHTHEKVHITPFNKATKLITSLAEKVPVFLIIGNHDLINHSQFLTTNHAFNAFKKIDNVTVCDRVKIKSFGDCKFVFCPYVPPERFEEALDTVQQKGYTWTDATCIFAHQEFYGCSFNPVTKSTSGDIYPEEYPFVISGHIHDSQQLQKNIYYTGSSMQHAFGESANKTVAFVVFEKEQEPKITRVKLGLKKKKLVYMNLKDVQEQFKPDPRYEIKLVISGDPQDFKVFRKSLFYKNVLQKQGIKVAFTSDQNKDYLSQKNLIKKNVMDILHDIVKDNQDLYSEYKQLLQK